MKKINYTEGMCFYVPLRDGGFARGLVTRMDGDGRVFAYFFGPKLAQINRSFDGLLAQDTVLSGLCGDLGLLNGKWPLAEEIKDWDRKKWPLPALYREDENAKRAWLSYYDDDTLGFLREESTDLMDEQNSVRPYDRLMGYGSVEIRLTKILS